MTRDEAVAALVNVDVSTAIYAGDNEKLVDKLVAIGVLELDEPKTPDDILREHLPNEGYIWAQGVLGIIKNAGLKVVHA